MPVLRSVLYMPSANERALEKAKSLPADAIIFDLEDAVAPDAKEAARASASSAVKSGAYGHRVLTIRCNGLHTPWGEADVVAAAAAAPAAVVIPKVSTVEEISAVASILDANNAPATTGIWAMVETPLGVLNAHSLAQHPRCTGFVIGTNDLAKELHAPLVAGRANLVPHLAHALLAGRAAGIVVLDGVFNNIKDTEGFESECRQGFEMGFDGKTLIHPSQIEFCNLTWSPSEIEVNFAKKVIFAFSQASTHGQGVLTVDGRMIENLHVENAKRTLALHDAIRQ
ncbi:MAG: CoA ester lyase [Acidimicrobiales bacterium]|nr:CoA ester lyase [Acidimicrobiales bacterium]